MSEMVERVARAMFENAFGENAIVAWEDADTQTLDCYMSDARAAIAAMREPFIEMEVEATEQWLCIEAQEDRAATIWRAMIDRALNHEKGSEAK